MTILLETKVDLQVTWTCRVQEIIFLGMFEALKCLTSSSSFGFNFLMSKGLFSSLWQMLTDQMRLHFILWFLLATIQIYCSLWGKTNGFKWRQLFSIVWIFVIFFVFLGWKFWSFVNKDTIQHKIVDPLHFLTLQILSPKEFAKNPTPLWSEAGGMFDNSFFDNSFD